MTDSKPQQSETPFADLNYSHPLETWLKKDWVRVILRRLSARRRPGQPAYLEKALLTYGAGDLSWPDRLGFLPIHGAIDWMRGKGDKAELRRKLAEHHPTIRGIVATAQSVGRYGLSIPQRWIHPLFVVWNFTSKCDLKCRHCYQSGVGCKGGELSREEKLRVIDELGEAYVAMVAFAGGEPTLSEDLEPALRRCQHHGMHTSIATHGGHLSRERCRQLADCGLRYVEVSLDSIHATKHDRFRGVPGAWDSAVNGLRNVVATEGMRAGLAMCVHQGNLKEVEAMIRFAVDEGVSCFAHFNFIPVGSGAQMADQDITPQQREDLLALLHEWMQSRKIGVISTAPQFGRFCMTHAAEDGLISCSHAGNGPGAKARVVARYLGGCGAGRTYACFQPNGDVTPCVYMPARVMGNLRDKPFADIFQQSPWWDLLCDRDERDGQCGHCDYRSYCGGCRARADAYFNRLDHVDPGCMHNDRWWQRIIEQRGDWSSSESKAKVSS